MNLNAVFLETVEDLRARCSLTATEYDAVQASGLLRRLLTDGTPVAPRFIASEQLPQPTYRWMSVYLGEVSSIFLDPEVYEATGALEVLRARIPEIDGIIREGALEDFLAAQISSGITVKDLIRRYSHVEGGVHHGARNDGEPARLESLLTSPVYEPRLRLTLVAIGRIVCRALAGAAAIVAVPDMDPRVSASYQSGTWAEDILGTPCDIDVLDILTEAVGGVLAPE